MSFTSSHTHKTALGIPSGWNLEGYVPAFDEAPDFAPSKYQSAVFYGIEKTDDSLLIEAVAGSGKTTTIVQAVELMPTTATILFLAFNKSIARELGARLPEHVVAKTFHGVCLGAWLRFVGGRKDLEEFIDGDKMKRIVKSELLGLSKRDVQLYLPFVCKLVSLAKNAGIGTELLADESRNWLSLVAHFDLSIDSEDADIGRGIQIARKALAISTEYGEKVIDYDDMLYLCLLHKVTFFQNDFVLVDEAQDTNGVQRALLKKMVKSRGRGGRVIAVGDTAQAIYGFRGADSDAMRLIAEDFNCTRLPLSVSYRCPKAVVNEAKSIVPHIEAFEKAPEGEVVNLKDYAASDFTNRDAILCRNVAPLVSMAYGLLTRNVACQVLGRDIGKGLVALVKKLKAKGIGNLKVKLEEWRRREVSEAQEKDNEALIERINDQAACVTAFVEMLDENNRTVPALIRQIESLFADDDDKRDVLTLCSAHKSKGLEWNTVYLLDRNDLMPSKWARQEWQKVQEQNLIYVAYTRAKRSLRFIKSGEWKSPEQSKLAA